MTKLIIHLNKSIEENASEYYEKAKKIKKKITGAEKALEQSKKIFEELQNRIKQENEGKEAPIKRKKEWYEKFRWFKSSEGFLVIGGRDATSNEIVIKKHTEKNDLVFHTDIAGSPFLVIKSGNKKVGEPTIKEAADATCSYSKAWKLGLATTSVFYALPEQVSKKTKAGEYMNKGSFMIYGKVNYVESKINLAIGATEDEKIMGGPLKAIEAHCKKYVELLQGNEKASDAAKYIRHKIGGSLDEIVRALPGGGCKVKKD